MIKKSIIFTIFLLVCWGFFINNRPFSLSQHQWQDNIISAEKFIFDLDSIDNLIVGTSLARRVRMDSLPNYYNLSFGGLSIFDGLNILRNKNNLPKNVFIETNLISGSENKNFKKIISSSILNSLKESSNVFRTDKQPLAYISLGFLKPLVSGVFSNVIYRMRDRMKFKFCDEKKNIILEPSSPLFDKMLTSQIKNYSKNINLSEMDKGFNNLKKNVNFLKSKGVNVIFFEMPINPKLVYLNKSNYIRDRVIAEYPDHDFIKIPENFKSYKTTDGVHLTKEESKLYTKYFKKKAISITQNVSKD